MKIAIVAEHTSAKFGGEAILPLHYFREFNELGHDVWLITHERTREEISSLFPALSHRIIYSLDTRLIKLLFKLGRHLPNRLSLVTTGFASRMLNQSNQKRLLLQLIHAEHIEIVHQPIPVSPREPSMLHDLGIPVVHGPMNGNMTFPPAFRHMDNATTRFVQLAVRTSNNLINRLIPGKIKGNVLFVANERTRQGLPQDCHMQVLPLVENGVDLSKFVPRPITLRATADLPGEFIFVGRLEDWKAVDIIIDAVKHLSGQGTTCTMSIVGDGVMRNDLENQARALGIHGQQHLQETAQVSRIHFLGWKSQEECAKLMGQSTALLLPSVRECGGAVVLEAMAVGIPVIATNWGGPADYLDASTGILINPDSRSHLVSEFANAMKHLMTEPAAAKALATAGQAKVLSDFNWKTKAKHVEEIFRAHLCKTLQQSAERTSNA